MAKFHFHPTLLTRQVEKNVRVALSDVGKKITDRVVSSMGPGAGRKVKIDGRIHTRSLPGQPPAPFTSRLRDSITFRTNFGDKSTVGTNAKQSDAIRQPKPAMGGYVVSIGTNVPYALSLEKGTRPKNARPYLWPALKASRADIREAFNRV
jgi:hypothetical protein